MNSLRNPAINTSLEEVLTRDRLEKYLEAASGDLDHALSLYERNSRIAEAFYTPLQTLEICLRNRIHRNLSLAYGSRWFEANSVPLQSDVRRDIDRAKAAILQSRKLITTGRIVAELNFGSWVSLLGPRYDATLWRTSLFSAFRETGRNMRRDRVHRRLNALRRLRNRIAHHEPIFHRDLETDHAEVIETIRWMSADTADWAMLTSRFPEVFRAG